MENGMIEVLKLHIKRARVLSHSNSSKCTNQMADHSGMEFIAVDLSFFCKNIYSTVNLSAQVPVEPKQIESVHGSRSRPHGA